MREIAVRWNQIEAGAEHMYAKLIKLEFVYEDGEIRIMDCPLKTVATPTTTAGGAEARQRE